MIHSKYRAFARQGTLTEQDIESPELPAGCHFHLDEMTQKQVIKKIRESLRMNQNALIDTAKSYLEDIRRNSTEPDIRPTVIDFINRYGLGLPQITAVAAR